MEMLLEDRISISTPEGVGLELTLAGLGSRFVAALLDTIIKLVVIVAILLALAYAGNVGYALAALAIFLVQYGYDVLFEVLAAGRTLGKRWCGLRVVTSDGRPIGLIASAGRNLMRVVDFLPAVYIVGSISILASARNQRLGDIVAHTIVVRERSGGKGPWIAPTVPVLAADLAATDVSGLGQTELVAVRRFLDRRDQLGNAARAQLAADLEARLRPRVAGIPESYRGEQFLEAVAAVKASRA
jgi:uncharacterized RDD family membrane protein YckC